MNKTFFALIAFAVFILTACGTEHTPDFVEGKIVTEEKTVAILPSDNIEHNEGFFREDEESENQLQTQEVKVFVLDSSIQVPIMEIDMDALNEETFNIEKGVNFEN